MAEHDSIETDAPEDAQEPVQGSTQVTEANAPSTDALQKDRDEVFDRLLRKTAEFDNYRKRIERERKEFTEWAAADVLTDLLAVIDDLDRALATEAPAEAQAYKAGVELIRHSLLDLLRKRGVTAIEAAGAEFDPHLHQAVAYEAVHGAAEGTVVEELRQGYTLGERLLRASLVKVAKAS